MLIFERAKLVYLANPKTGTSAFEQQFGQYSDYRTTPGKSKIKHLPYYKLERKFRFFANNFEVITCVRAPLDTLSSWYRYRQREALDGTERSTKGVTFEEFVRQWASDDPAPFAQDTGDYKSFLCRNNGELGNIKLFHYKGRPSIDDYTASKLGLEDYTPETRNESPAIAHAGGEDLIATLPKLKAICDFYASLTFANDPA